MKYLIKKVNINVIFISLFIISAIFLHRKSYDKLPMGVHALQQSDHYAIALGFLDNGFNFFKPTSYTLNLEFPAEQNLVNPQGITAVDFPVLHYSVALIMKASNSRSPVIFRLVTWLLSFISLLFFFRTIVEFKGFWIAIFLCGFIMYQPIYSFHQNGFHVSGSAFNLFLIGFSFLIKYFHNNNYTRLLWGMTFLTLAALMRFTQIIPILAFLCMLIYYTIKDKKFDLKIIVVILSLGIVMAYFGYNRYLSRNYGSIFLNHPVIAESFSEFFGHFIKTIKVYFRSFLPILHLFSIGVIVYLKRFYKRQMNDSWNMLRVWIYFSFIGNLLFSIIMSFSISFHDYYVLDTWLPLVVMFVVYMIFFIDLKKISTEVSSIFIAMFLLGSLGLAFETQSQKYSQNNISGASLIIKDFKESANFINKHLVDCDRPLLICYYGWNTPMIGWQQKTFRVANDFEEQIPFALEKNFDVIITHDSSFKITVLENYSEFHSKVNFVEGNGKVSIWKLKE